MLVLADGFEIQGTAHLGGMPDLRYALDGELQRFFPITEASVFNPATGERIEAPVVMPNKRFVSPFSLGERIRAGDNTLVVAARARRVASSTSAARIYVRGS